MVEKLENTGKLFEENSTCTLHSTNQKFKKLV